MDKLTEILRRLPKEQQDKIFKDIETLQAKSAVAPELRAFATLFLKVLAEAKSDFSNISKENQAKIDQAFAYLEQEHVKLQNNVSQVTDSAKIDFENSLSEIKDLIKKIQTIKPIDGVDGYTPVKGEDYFTDSDIKEIKDEVLKDIPTVEEETGESIVSKINDLPTDDEDLKIDAKHVKNFPEQVRYYAGGSGIKEIIAGTNITVDNTNLGYPIISSTGGGTPGGSDTQLQYNNAGSFGGISGATTNGTTVTFTTGNLLATDVKASGSGGLHLHNNTGQDCFLSGLGGGINNTAYGALKLDFATATTVPYLDASKNLVSSAVTPTELGYLSGVTSSIQTQINTKFTLPSLTSGSVLFSNGTTIAQDNSNFFWNDTNNRLGVGTNSPTATLHILTTPTNLTSIKVVYPYNVGNSNKVFSINNDAGLETFAVGMNGSSDEGNLYLKSPSGQGNGVGITFNSNVGGITRTGLFQLDNSGNMVFRQSQSGMFFDYFDKAYWRDGSFNVRMMLNSSGNVGIATLSPASKLHINASPTSSANYGTLSLGGGAFDGSTSGYFVGSSSGTSLAVNEASGYIGNLINLQIAGSSKFKVDKNGLGTATRLSAEQVGTTYAAIGADYGSYGGLYLTNTSAVQWFNGSINTTIDVSISRNSAGNLALNSTTSGDALGTLALSQLVEANTAGSGSPNILLASESNKLLTNEGATAKNYHTLPSAAAGLQFYFVAPDADGMRITAATGDVIHVGSIASSSGGYIETTTQYASIILKAINSTDWVAFGVVETWTAA